jgi:hypothetical protein
MDRALFEDSIYRNWAGSPGCAVDDLRRPGTLVMPFERLAGKNSVHIWRFGSCSVVLIDPQRTGDVESLMRSLQPGEALTLDHVERLFEVREPAEVDEAYIAVDHEVACGCFEREEFVAAGSGGRTRFHALLQSGDGDARTDDRS